MPPDTFSRRRFGAAGAFLAGNVRALAARFTLVDTVTDQLMTSTSMFGTVRP